MRQCLLVGLAVIAALQGTPAQSQVVQQLTRPQVALATDPASQIVALQQQVAALQQQNAALQQALVGLQTAVQALQVKTQWVTATASDLILNPPGDVNIRNSGPTGNVRIQANNTLDIRANVAANFQSATDLNLRSGGNTTVNASGTAAIWGASVQLNRPSPAGPLAPAAIVGSLTSPGPQGGAGKVLTGSTTVSIAP